jgi:hypothetical protein
MFARFLLVCAAALCVPVLAAPADEPKDKNEKETKLKPTVVYRGSHSAILKEDFKVVTTQAAWERVEKQHRGESTRFTETLQDLQVDYDTHYVVAVFAGGSGWRKWCKVTALARGEAIVLRVESGGCQTVVGYEEGWSEEKKARWYSTAPYVFVVLPRPVKTIVIEKDVRSQLGDPPLWKEQKRFPAPKDMK